MEIVNVVDTCKELKEAVGIKCSAWPSRAKLFDSARC